jgi:hypothetical protein
MVRFSERYGYTQPSSILIREKLTEEIENAICSAYDTLYDNSFRDYYETEKHLWCHFFNKRLKDYG